MKTVRRKRPNGSAPAADSDDSDDLRRRLAEALETLRVIRSGEVDAVIVDGKQGLRVYTLVGAEHAYRVLIESMNEGALTLTADRQILYANQSFARLVKLPLEQVIGVPFQQFLPAGGGETIRALCKGSRRRDSKLQLHLTTGDGTRVPVLLSMRFPATNGAAGAVSCIVVTDLTEVRRNEELLRDLSHRLMKAQEFERMRVAVELHDNITQLLCAVLVRSQLLEDRIPVRQTAARGEAAKLREMLGRTATEVERISRNLRPGVLRELGLLPVLRSTAKEFTARTGVPIRLNCTRLSARLPAETELALYRILQEALKNVEMHAVAHHASVRLARIGSNVEMAIEDDGIGFDPDRRPRPRKPEGGFGLLDMRERAASVHGEMSVRSSPGHGTTIRAEIPLRRRRGGASPA